MAGRSGAQGWGLPAQKGLLGKEKKKERKEKDKRPFELADAHRSVLSNLALQGRCNLHLVALTICHFTLPARILAILTPERDLPHPDT